MTSSSDHEALAEVAAGPAVLPLDRYADVLAHTVYFGPSALAEVLVRLDVDPAVWASSDNKWMDAILAEVREEEHPIITAFALVYTPAQKRLKMERPSLESIGLLPKVAELAEAQRPAPAAPAAVAEPAPVLAPSFMLAPLAAASNRSAPPGLQGTSLALDVPRGQAMPFLSAGHTSPDGRSQGAAAHTVAGQGPPIASPTRKQVGGDTVELSEILRSSGLLPFGPGVAGASSFAAPPAAALPVASPLRGTSLAVDVPAGTPPEPALPFLESRGQDPARALENAVLHAEALQGPRGGSATPANVGEATVLGANGPPAGGPLPFQQAPAPGQQPAQLTMEQYASLSVDLETAPERTSEILHRYGLTSAQKAVLDDHFQGLFARAPSYWLAFDRARASYKAWLSQVRSRG